MTCTCCQKSKDCTEIFYGQVGNVMKAIPKGATNTGLYTHVKSVYLCDECAAAGKAPKKSYSLTVIGCAMSVIGTALIYSAGNVAIAPAAMLISIGWLLALISAMVVVMSGQAVFTTGQRCGYILSVFVPLLGLIVFLVNRKKLLLGVQAQKAGLPLAEKLLDEEQAPAAELAANADTLTESEREDLEDKVRERELMNDVENKSAAASAAEASHKKSYWGLAVTALILFVGLICYSNDYYFVLLGGIELKEFWQFGILAGVYTLIDLLSITGSKKKVDTAYQELYTAEQALKEYQNQNKKF